MEPLVGMLVSSQSFNFRLPTDKSQRSSYWNCANVFQARDVGLYYIIKSDRKAQEYQEEPDATHVRFDPTWICKEGQVIARRKNR
jgi:hypothetical protein